LSRTFLRIVGCWILALLMAGGACPQTAGAQVRETPVPFDSAGAVQGITPALAARLGLVAPVWPLRDDYVEVRLYTSSAGGYVLVAERRDGSRDRFTLAPGDAEALRSAVTVALAHAGRVVGAEGLARISEPARDAFVRNQIILAAAMYGPSAAALTHDAKAGTVVYLVSVGGTYFLITDMSKHITVTRAQNALTTDGALRTTALLFGSYLAFGTEVNSDIAAATALAGGIGGSVIGYRLGRGVTDAESKAMTSGSTIGALGAVGIAGTFGLGELENRERWIATAAVVGGLLGYGIGPVYPRNTRYTVTKGDIQLIDLAALLGGMVGAIPIAGDDHPDTRLASGLITAGGLVGLWAGDRGFARPFDHTESDSRLVGLGALAGGLLGAAVPVLTESDNGSFILGSVTLGAVLGTIGAESLVGPRTVRDQTRTGSNNGREFRLNLGGAAMAALGRPGIFPIGRITF
jgi:hypothetical protein